MPGLIPPPFRRSAFSGSALNGAGMSRGDEDHGCQVNASAQTVDKPRRDFQSREESTGFSR